ncbi:hypothetical protein TPA0910_84230 [Streptomyces hygroscopicus subsp. sporocinereus]|uniref:MFS transporter n=1 Tax=Streptomyces hygroscopicus TaxID=1912 RepID=A0ABQ3UEF2_STRHY|nr:hypothetical protein TPA0910_84230 [Streptomyces hygroscopicus]
MGRTRVRAPVRDRTLNAWPQALHAKDHAGGSALAEEARSAFTEAQSLAMTVGVAAALAGAAVAFFALPGRAAPGAVPEPESEAAGRAS